MFFKRFRCVLGTKYKFPGGTLANCKLLIKEMKQTGKVQIGRSRIMYTARESRDMELIRNLAVEKAYGAEYLRFLREYRWSQAEVELRYLGRRCSHRTLGSTSQIDQTYRGHREIHEYRWVLIQVSKTVY